MEALDWFTRLLLLPGIILMFIRFIPEAAEDVRQWSAMLTEDSKERARLRAESPPGIKLRKSKIPSVGSTEYRVSNKAFN